MRERSSFHRIDGDRPRSRAVRVAWLATNAVWAELPPRATRARRFVPPTLPAAEDVPAAATPARVLGNLFWESLPAERIRAALGDSVRLLDVGCGRGGYFRLLDRSLGLDDYVGIDVAHHREWNAIVAEDARARFVVRSAEGLTREDLDGRTLVISQSALEHIPRDLVALRSIHNARDRDSPLLQLHLVPPPALWRLWGVHGYRGYTSRSLDRIRAALHPSLTLDVIVLGGPKTNAVHLELVHDAAAALRGARVRDTRAADPQAYGSRLVDALRADAEAPGPARILDASFLVLAIRDREMPDVLDELAHGS